MTVKVICAHCEKTVKKNETLTRILKMVKVNGAWIQYVEHCK